MHALRAGRGAHCPSVFVCVAHLSLEMTALFIYLFICTGDLGSHPEARLQPRNPNGWGATRCCIHYRRCLYTWLNDDSEVETSRGKEKINTACPCCRKKVSRSEGRMLG